MNLTIICAILGAVMFYFIAVPCVSKILAPYEESAARYNQFHSIYGQRRETKRIDIAQSVSDIKKRQFERLQSQKKKETRKRTSTDDMLDAANVPLTSTAFRIVQVSVGLILGVALYYGIGLTTYANYQLFMFPLGVVISFLILNILVKNMIKKKKAKVLRQLPDMLDLLVVSMEAGLGFDAAMIRVHEKSHNELTEEMIRANMDIKHGMTKKEAYKNIADRCDVKELTSFLNALVQSEELGVSVKTVLKSQSEILRESRRLLAEEKAAKAPVKMMLPLVMFIFPVIFIILLAPAAVNMMDTLL